MTKIRATVRSWKRWLAIGVVGSAAALVVGPFVFLHLVEGKAPPPLSLSSPSPAATETASTGGGGTSAGTWRVAGGSVVGYRVKEVLFGQSNEAVGRTTAVTGSITVRGTTITGGSFTVDMATVASDQSRRDAQFNGRIMETSVYPTATFQITRPIDVRAIPADGEQRTLKASGRLTLHGVTRTVTFEVTGRLSGSTIQVAGSIPITFSDWNIGNPSFGPVTTEDHGTLEFALNLTKA